MIKKFEEYINEDYFSKLATRKDNGNVRKENEITEDYVRSFLAKNADNMVKSISFRKHLNKTVVDIDGDFYLDERFEEIPFQFGKVTGEFNCFSCNITSLKGCPKEVGGDFDCSNCDKLKSLDGCPENVGGDFFCYDCDKQFTEDEVKSLCNVKGYIKCNF